MGGSPRKWGRVWEPDRACFERSPWKPDRDQGPGNFLTLGSCQAHTDDPPQPRERLDQMRNRSMPDLATSDRLELKSNVSSTSACLGESCCAWDGHESINRFEDQPMHLI